jgi:hypothetical protein
MFAGLNSSRRCGKVSVTATTRIKTQKNAPACKAGALSLKPGSTGRSDDEQVVRVQQHAGLHLH